MMLFYLLIVGFIGEIVTQKAGDECETKTGLFGFVKNYRECEYLKTKNYANNKAMRNEIKDLRVGQDSNNSPLFCCPLRKADEACRTMKMLQFKPEDSNDSSVDRFIGGTKAKVGEFPHFAALAYIDDEGQLIFRCGGSLISDQFVLTAAHCCNKEKPPIKVRLGRASMDSMSDRDKSKENDIDIKEILVHPNYVVPSKYNDIALLRLKVPVTFSALIKPACLKPKPKIIETTELIITGFGRTHDKKITEEQKSNWLLTGFVNEIVNEKCNRTLNNELKYEPIEGFKKGITKEIMCAKNRQNQYINCQGGYGSGLLVKDNGVNYVVGVTSFGFGCNSKLPSLYTKVEHYINWIEGIVWP